MESYEKTNDIYIAGRRHPDIDLRHLLRRRIESLKDAGSDFDLADLFNVIVIEAGDTVEELEQAIPHSVLTDWADRDWFDPGFTPPWEVCEIHPRWFEITFILCDDGFGVVVYVPRQTCTDTVLLYLCERYGVLPIDTTADLKKELDD